MKTLLISTIIAQISLLPYFVYIMRKGYWTSAFYFFRQTFHLVLAAYLVYSISEFHWNPFVLVAYFGLTFEEFLNIRILSGLVDRFIGEKLSDASIETPMRVGVINFYINGMKIDLVSLITMFINLADRHKFFNSDNSDPVCAESGKGMSVAEILLHPGNYGHEVLRVVALGLLLIL